MRGKKEKEEKKGTKKHEKGESTKNEFVILRCTASENWIVSDSEK